MFHSTNSEMLGDVSNGHIMVPLNFLYVSWFFLWNRPKLVAPTSLR